MSGHLKFGSEKTRKRFKRKMGHRQNFTEVKITSISA